MGDAPCALCRQLADPATRPLPVEGPWSAVIGPRLPAPGWYLLVLHRHVEDLAALDEGEARSLGPSLARLTAAVRRTTGAERVYVASFGENHPHVHFQVAPRGPGDDLRGPALLLDVATRFDEAGAVAHREQLRREMEG